MEATKFWGQFKVLLSFSFLRLWRVILPEFYDIQSYLQEKKLFANAMLYEIDSVCQHFNGRTR